MQYLATVSDANSGVAVGQRPDGDSQRILPGRELKPETPLLIGNGIGDDAVGIVLLMD